MATEITMPQLSDTMDQGTILKWFKKIGDPVSRGDALAEVATDKADLEIESFHEGTLLDVRAEEGSVVKVGELIALIGKEGEEVPAASSSNSKPENESAETASSETKEAEKTQPGTSQNTQSEPAQPASSRNGVPATHAKSPESSTGDRIKISPLARNIAQSHGIDFSKLSGSGEGGRITKRDVESHIQASPGSAPSSTTEQKPITLTTPVSEPAGNYSKSVAEAGKMEARISPLSKMRNTIANRMVESVTTAPHFYATSKLEVGALLKARAVLKEQELYEGITVTHLVTKAVALSLRAFPRINAKYDNGSLVEPQSINIGIITALPDGLLIPVVKNADELSLADVVSESRALVQRARSGKPKGEDLQGGTFSISNIGKNEVEHFTAIINPGQGAILAVSSIQDEALVKDGSIVPGKTMRVTLSVDHRIIDGVMAGEFLTHLKKLIEEPLLILA